MAEQDTRIHEVTFCSRAAGWANELFGQHPEWPFRRAEIEESKAINRKRSDLRVHGDAGRLILAGEVKMPGTAEGRTAYSADLVEEAAQKADNAGAEFFFTWNINQLVLFDRKKWQLPILVRRVQEYPLGLELGSPEEVERAEVQGRIKDFLAKFFGEFAAIVAGAQPGWGMGLDEWFVRAFESHISWAVKLTGEYLLAESAAHPAFGSRLQDWMVNEQGWIVSGEAWHELIDRCARTLCYVFANRLIFYESVRAKFAELAPLEIPKQLQSAGALYEHFQRTFQKAVEATGDYETLFYPFEKDWAGPLIFGHAGSGEAWRAVARNLEPFNFKLIPTDILGGIFRRIIDPEERHKFGQHYTNEDLVDVVNAFCILQAEDNVLDPACGSGSFLVRAYQRKAWLGMDERLAHQSVCHQDRLAQIYGADVSVFAAHLSTLNLAARDIKDEENYPRIRRGNFFEIADEVAKKKPFCLLPRGLQGERAPGPIALPPLQAVVGNPPYVRQELIPKRGQNGVKRMQAKEDLLELCSQFWPGLKLSGRADLHCYFWPAATHFLAADGRFGFLVSSSWLDVEYGFALQEWVLSHFRILAVLESNAEPWFEDARVKTCAVILRRCDDPKERGEQWVKFVRLDAPLREILGEREDENARQTAAEKLRDIVLRCKTTTARDQFRIVVVRQKKLWEDGLRAGQLFQLQRRRDLAEGVRRSEGGEEEENGIYDENGNGMLHEESGAGYGRQYGGGKWGKYLRAPNLYFKIMESYGSRFVPLGEIATIRFGVKSGCDAFFMPRDVSQEYLEKYSKLEWNDAPLMTHCKRAEVESGEVKLIQAGDGTVHPVEAKYLVPEIHNLMRIKTAQIRPAELERRILYVNKNKAELKGSYVLKYLKYGETTSFASKKSKAVPVAQRPTCASRDAWYNLTYTKPGELLWPMFSQYRLVVPTNPLNQVANNNLSDLRLPDLSQEQKESLCAIANSTFIALSKTYFARYTGSEGNLQMKIIDLNLMEIPDPRLASKKTASKLRKAFHDICQRTILPMAEEEFMECHSIKRARKLAEKPIGLPAELKMKDRRALDLAVFELLGVTDAGQREALCDELYRETAAHFRQIRVVEIQKQEQRAETAGREFRTDELAADLWDSLSEAERQPLGEWLAAQTAGGKSHTIPEGTASLPDASDFLDASTVFFRQSISGKSASNRLPLPSRSHAEMVFALSQAGLHGDVRLPEGAGAARVLKQRLDARLAGIAEKADHLAQSRTSDERKAADVAGLLRHWMIHGKPQMRQ